LDIIDFEKYKNSNKFNDFELDLVKRIPLHVQKYMEIHNIFAHDIEETDFASRMSIAHKKQQALINQGFEYSEEISRRQSVMNIKDFIDDIRKQEYFDRQITEETNEDRSDSRESSTRLPTVDGKF
jgi:hypothetical protein